jgi:hypothetical protein
MKWHKDGSVTFSKEEIEEIRRRIDHMSEVIDKRIRETE